MGTWTTCIEYIKLPAYPCAELALGLGLQGGGGEGQHAEGEM